MQEAAELFQVNTVNILKGEKSLEALDKLAGYLEEAIQQAAEKAIPRRRPSARSKVWWSNSLKDLRKEMNRQKCSYRNINQSDS